MANLDYDHELKRITVLSPAVEVTIQELYDKSKDEEDFNHIAMTTGVILTATGKEPLGGGTSVGITISMQNGWKLGFEARGTPTSVNVTGGNLVDSSGIVGDQFFQTTNVQIQYASSSSGTLQEAQTLENLKHAVESQAFDHGAGNIFYWNPNSGSDLQDGTNESNAVKTFVKAQTLVTAGAGDVIYCITPDVTGSFTITESLVITKNKLHLRGTGRNQIFDPATATTTIQILNANDVSIKEFEVRGNQTGTNNVLDLHGLRTVLEDLHITNFTGHGISIHNCVNCRMRNLKIENGTGVGEAGAGFHAHNTKDFILENVEFSDMVADGVYIKADTLGATNNNLFRNCTLHNNGGYDINISDANIIDTVIDQDCYLGGDGLGRILNNGTNTKDLDITNQVKQIKGGRSLDR